MQALSYVEAAETALPLELVVNRQGSGPVGGLSPTVAVRDASTTDSYLDFADMIFKTSGWAERELPLTEVRPGVYASLLDVSTIVGVAPGLSLAMEYEVRSPPDPPDVAGVDVDAYLVTDAGSEITLVRKYHTNRLVETGGNPGHLDIYDDDDLTVLREHELRDASGGGIVTTPGSPARRSKGAP